MAPSGIRFSRGLNAYHYLPKVSRGVHPPGDAVNRMAISLLHQWKDERVFLYVHYMDVHTPYNPPAPYRAQFVGSGNDRLDGDGPRPDISQADVAYARALYGAEIRALDDLTRDLMQSLDALTLTSSTLVICTSDHGDEFHENGGLGHGWTLYEEVVRTPLLFVHPHLQKIARKIAAPVSLVDILPTVFDLTGGGTLEGIDGESLAPLNLRDEDSGPGGETRVLFSELGMVKAVRRGSPKLIRWLDVPRQEAYDLSQDVHEMTRRRTTLWMGDMARSLDEFTSAQRRGTELPTPVASDRVDPATAERLRALGYLDWAPNDR